MSDLQAYLASKYMTGPKADAILEQAQFTTEGGNELKRKKKKRKLDSVSNSKHEIGSGLIIADDDGLGWESGKQKEEEDEDAKPVIETKRGQFKSKSSNSWSTIRPSANDIDEPVYTKTPSPEPTDVAPYIVSTTEETTSSNIPPPSKGGLQSVASLKAEQARRKALEEQKRLQSEQELFQRRQEMKERGEDEDEENDPMATVYRDSSGKRIDMKLKKAEEAKRKRDELEREMKKMEWGKGLVQKGEKEERKKEMEKMAARPIARYADDVGMNEELKEQDRWNDPAANFLTKKKEKKTTGPRFPKYAGPMPAPNRFGIPPGYRWDGVDRSNGFEATYMQRNNSVRMRAAEAHAYSTEDM